MENVHLKNEVSVLNLVAADWISLNLAKRRGVRDYLNYILKYGSYPHGRPYLMI